MALRTHQLFITLLIAVILLFNLFYGHSFAHDVSYRAGSSTIENSDAARGNAKPPMKSFTAEEKNQLRERMKIHFSLEDFIADGDKKQISPYMEAVIANELPPTYPPPPPSLATHFETDRKHFTQSLMSCHDENTTPNKLIFVHIFKTAGSTVREFFNRYAENCKRGWVAVTSCSDVSSESLKMLWQTAGNLRKPEGCRIVDHVTRKSSEENKNHKPVDTGFLRRNADILGGHLSLGSDPWADIREDVSVTYLTFVRDSAIKYVSGFLYSNPSKGGIISDEEYSVMIKNRVIGARHDNAFFSDGFSGMAKYLLTPKQKKELERRHGINVPITMTKVRHIG